MLSLDWKKVFYGRFGSGVKSNITSVIFGLGESLLFLDEIFSELREFKLTNIIYMSIKFAACCGMETVSDQLMVIIS